MSEGGFLAAICAQPDEDTPRLAFADWLDEHGQPVRAQFIRDQIELARMDEADARYPALLARMRRCGVFTDPTHRLECEKQVYGAMFRRGFVAGIEADGYVPPEFGQLPVEQLRLSRPESDPAGNAATLAARPELAKLRTLIFDGGWSTRHLATILTANPRLTALRALSIGYPDDEDDPRIWEIVPHFNLPALDSLALHLGTFNDDDRSRELSDWGDFTPASMPPLRRLHLDGRWFWRDDRPWPGPDYAWLMRTRHCPTLEVADMRMCLEFMNAPLELVAVAPPSGLFEWLAGLRFTRLICNGEELAERGILGSRDWGQIDSLTVHHGPTNDALMTLLSSPQARNLRRLNLNMLKQATTASAALREAIRDTLPWPNLRHLSISGCPEDLLRGNWRHNLLRLDVGFVGNASAVELVAKTHLPELRHLTIGRLPSDTKPEDALAPLFTTRLLPNLSTLVVNHFGLSPAALAGLANNRYMPHLSLICANWDGKHCDWWVTEHGTATPVVLHTKPIDEDWWEPDPLLDWFW